MAVGIKELFLCACKARVAKEDQGGFDHLSMQQLRIYAHYLPIGVLVTYARISQPVVYLLDRIACILSNPEALQFIRLLILKGVDVPGADFKDTKRRVCICCLKVSKNFSLRMGRPVAQTINPKFLSKNFCEQIPGVIIVGRTVKRIVFAVLIPANRRAQNMSELCS